MSPRQPRGPSPDARMEEGGEAGGGTRGGTRGGAGGRGRDCSPVAGEPEKATAGRAGRSGRVLGPPRTAGTGFGGEEPGVPRLLCVSAPHRSSGPPRARPSPSVTSRVSPQIAFPVWWAASLGQLVSCRGNAGVCFGCSAPATGLRLRDLGDTAFGAARLRGRPPVPHLPGKRRRPPTLVPAAAVTGEAELSLDPEPLPP